MLVASVLECIFFTMRLLLVSMLFFILPDSFFLFILSLLVMLHITWVGTRFSIVPCLLFISRSSNRLPLINGGMGKTICFTLVDDFFVVIPLSTSLYDAIVLELTTGCLYRSANLVTIFRCFRVDWTEKTLFEIYALLSEVHWYSRWEMTSCQERFVFV